jgi:hypothetical protein
MTSSQYAPTVVQTISNPDGTVSIIHVDSSNPVITLPDGTTAQVQVSFELFETKKIQLLYFISFVLKNILSHCFSSISKVVCEF